MKYSISRKINLANISKELWPYETEDIGITEADSFEDAQKKVDQYYNERIGYYKAKSEEHKKATACDPHPGIITAPFPPPAPATLPPASIPASVPIQNPQSTAGISNNPPPEFI